jgi:hypothetical protein
MTKHTVEYEKLKDYDFSSLIACSSKDRKELYAVVKGKVVTYEVNEGDSRFHKFDSLDDAVKKYNNLPE